MDAAFLELRDGTVWEIRAGDPDAGIILSRLSYAMRLRPEGSASVRMCLRCEDIWPNRSDHSQDAPFFCNLHRPYNSDMLAVQTTRAGQIIGLSSESSGGLMVHGGLAEKEGDGLILAGPGGAGKTTVSERLQSPWRSLSDDAALVVRDTSGQYWGHPWPTWSRFMFGGPGGCWDVHQAVPLRRIVFLCRSSWDGLEPVSQGRASVLLAESAEQAGGSVLRRIQPDEARATRLRRFEAASCIARRIPCYQLHLSPNGNFERVIGSLW